MHGSHARVNIGDLTNATTTFPPSSIGHPQGESMGKVGLILMIMESSNDDETGEAPRRSAKIPEEPTDGAKNSEKGFDFQSAVSYADNARLPTNMKYIYQ